MADEQRRATDAVILKMAEDMGHVKSSVDTLVTNQEDNRKDIDSLKETRSKSKGAMALLAGVLSIIGAERAASWMGY